MKWLVTAILLLISTVSYSAQKLQFWNETSHEMTGVYLAPAGSGAFGANQALNDDDKSVGADERLVLTGVSAGRYDVRLVDTKGRTCLVKNVDLKTTGKIAFSISEKQLTDCK